MLIESDNIVTKPLVSVIVLVYNHEKYLETCLESIICQETNFPFEIIIGDDFSLDRSRDICLAYKNKYSEIIRLLFHEKNRGLINNYIQLKKACRGEYIAQVAGDDYWRCNQKLQKQVDFMEEHQGVGLCYTNTYLCDDDGNENQSPLLEKGYMPNSFEEQLFKSCYMAPNTWLMRKGIDDRISEQQVWFADESLAVALDYLHQSSMVFLDFVTAVYRVHEGSLAAQKDLRKRWEYSKGILKMQLYYAHKYNVDNETLERLLMQEYASKLLLAIEAKDYSFIDEALEFYSSLKMEMKWFVQSCEEYVNYKRRYEQVLRSHAYRLGKFLLKPLKVKKRK